ncbi:MAG: hypothetical protein H0X13_04535 [Ramlibacter sp.]|nr:hypothetical protein [Ramlibacter sp.]
MHSAPSVSYPVGRSHFAAWLQLGMWLMGVAAVVLWSGQVPGSRWRLAAAALLVLAGWCAAWKWWRAPHGVLHWDGEGWNWLAAGQSDRGMLEVSLDLQHWLLLRWRGESASHWLWIERAKHLERWPDLRRAVYSRARPQALRPDPSAQANP